MRKTLKKKSLVQLSIFLLLIFILMNVFSAIQAYSCTHFTSPSTHLKPNAKLSGAEIIKMLIFGVNIPKPSTKKYPDRDYEEVKITATDNQSLCAWLIKTDSVSKGLIIYFHGYGDEKSQMLDYAYQTLNLGYDALLVDFMAAGCSDGYRSTVGYLEASNVKSAFDYASNELKEENIYLFGFSMGAAAIIKAQHDCDMQVSGIIAEACYGKMYDTIRVRLGKASFISYPLACMFAFWGGLLNDMDAFDMNPEEYAKNINVPTLIACGEKDQYIPREETLRIFDNIRSEKKVLTFYPESTHELHIKKYPDEWKRNIGDFLTNN